MTKNTSNPPTGWEDDFKRKKKKFKGKKKKAIKKGGENMERV